MDCWRRKTTSAGDWRSDARTLLALYPPLNQYPIKVLFAAHPGWAAHHLSLSATPAASPRPEQGVWGVKSDCLCMQWVPARRAPQSSSASAAAAGKERTWMFVSHRWSEHMQILHLNFNAHSALVATFSPSTSRGSCANPLRQLRRQGAQVKICSNLNFLLFYRTFKFFLIQSKCRVDN